MSGLESSTGEELLQFALSEKQRAWEQAQLQSFSAKGKELKTDSWKAKYKGPAEPDADGFYDLPVGWAWASAEAICESVRDGTHDTPKYVAEGVPLITSKNLIDGKISFEKIKLISREDHEEISKRSGVNTGDILFAMIGTVGNPVVVSVDAEFSIKNVGLFKKNEAYLEPRYLRYWLDSPALLKWLTPRLKGTTQKFAPLGLLRALPVPVAPRQDQERIVAEIEKQFSRLDEAVANLKRVKANLKRYKAAVLKAAVEGKLTEQWRKQNPDVEPASKLLERILAERRTKWEKAELAKLKAKGKEPKDDMWKAKYKEPVAPVLGEDVWPIPDSWAWASIDQLCFVVRGASPRPAGDPKYFGGEIPWITVGDLTKGEHMYLDHVESYVTEAGREVSRYIEPGTFLLTNSGATLGVPKITRIGGCINDGSVALLDLSPALEKYMFYFLAGMTEKLRLINQGAAQPNLNTTIVKNISVAIPSSVELPEILSRLEAQLSSSSSVLRIEAMTSLRLTKARQSILAQAFSGR